MKSPIPFVFSLLIALDMALRAPSIIQEEEVLDLERGLIEDSTQSRIELENREMSMGEMQKGIQTSMLNKDNDDEVNEVLKSIKLMPKHRVSRSLRSLLWPRGTGVKPDANGWTNPCFTRTPTSRSFHASWLIESPSIP